MRVVVADASDAARSLGRLATDATMFRNGQQYWTGGKHTPYCRQPYHGGKDQDTPRDEYRIE